MENTSHITKKESSIVKDLLDGIFVPTSVIRLLRNAEKEGKNALDSAINRNRLTKMISYTGATGFELCRLGLYYKEILEPLYKSLTN